MVTKTSLHIGVEMPTEWVELNTAYEQTRASLIGTASALAAAVRISPELAEEWADRYDQAYEEHEAAFRALREWGAS